MVNPNKLLGKSYYEDSEYFSVSSYKKFLKCEADGLRPFGNPTESMMIGSYVDSWVEGTLDEFKADNPQIISSVGKTKGELKTGFKKAEQICEYIKNDSVFSQFMSGEKQTVMTGEIAGIPWKIKMDSYSPHIAINDLKVMESVTNKRGKYIDFITQWGYDIQMACYQEIVYQNTGEKLPCYICAVTKETPINSVIVNIPQGILDVALYNVTENAPRFWAIKTMKELPTGCGHCKTCIRNRIETPIISMYDIMEV